MKKFFICFTMLLSFSFCSLQAQDSLWAENFGPTGVSGTVKALTQWGDTLVVAGDIGGLRATSAFSPGFLLFDLNTRGWKFPIDNEIDYGDEVRAVEVMPNGDLVLGGNFSFTSNGMTLDYIAVYRKDGTWSTLSGDTSDFCDGPVNALLEFDGKLYIGGEFIQLGAIDSITTIMFAIWDELNGFIGTGDNEPIGFPINNGEGVYALEHVIDDYDYIYIGGEFETDYSDTLGNIVRINATTRMPENIPGGGTNGPVYALKRAASIHYDHEVYLGGEFTYAGGIAVNNCAMFESDDNIWHALGDGLNGPVYAIDQFGSYEGSMNFAGDFDSIGSMFAGNLPRWNISADQWYTSGIITDAPIYALENVNNDVMTVGGAFEFTGDSSLFYSVFQYEFIYADTFPTFYPLGDGLENYDNAFESANDVATDGLGNFYIIGNFDYAGGKLVNHIAKWDGTLWHSLGNGFETSGPALAVRGDTVYAARRYQIPGFHAHEILMWDGASWTAITPELPGTSINKMALDTAGNLYVVGSHLDTIGLPGQQGIIMWDGNQWSELGGPMTASSGVPVVEDIYIDSLTNEVFVTGRFATANGVSCSNVAVWNGSNWRGLGNSKTADGHPYIIERSPQGEIVISGTLDRPEFTTLYQDSLWIAYAGGISVPDVTDLLTVGCHIYIAGDPLQYVNTEDDPVRVWGVGVWDGIQWDSLGSGVNNGIFAMAAFENQMALAGNFNRAGDNHARGFAIWNGVVSGSDGSNLTLLAPAANDTLEYGTVFEIMWDTATTVEAITLEVSYDSAQTWEVIHTNIDSKQGALPWLVPDLDSANAMLRISEASAPCANVTGDLFTIVSEPGLEVTWLIRAGGTYYIEPYSIGYHNWSWRNSRANCWSDSAVALIQYPEGLEELSDSIKNFPDWYTLAEAFGDQWAYKNSNPNRPRSKSIKYWESRMGNWGGSCYGFSVTSLLWWFHNEFNTDLILPNKYMDDFELNEFTRSAINRHWTYQWGKKHWKYVDEVSNATPWQTLETVRNDMEYSYPRAINFWWRDWDDKLDTDSVVVDSIWKKQGHSVVPYAIRNAPDSAGIYYIFIYDNNAPTSKSRFFRIDSLNGTWSYPASNISDTNSLFVPSLPLNEYLGLATDDRKTKSDNLERASEILLLASATEEIIISNSAGEQIGWVNNDELNTLPGSFSIFPADPDYPYEYPQAYSLPDNDYQIDISKFQSNSTRVTLETATRTHSYERDDADSNENDRVYMGSGITVLNLDAALKIPSLTTIEVNGNIDRYVQIDSMIFAQNDSTKIEIDTSGAVIIENFNQAKDYSVILWYADDTLDSYTQSLTTISLAGNSTHKIEPVWSNLESGTLEIQIDNDMDGIFEDTIIADVATDIEDEIGQTLPNSYHLAQNYPNPFNPRTTIAFSLPTKADVKLEIINILGQKIKTLVNTSYPAGQHQLVWDGNTDNGKPVSSGVYFYRLTADDFVSTKKMLLLK